MYSKETNYDPTFGGTRVGIWIGLSGEMIKSNEGESYPKWTWQDGFPTAYTRWGANEPNLEILKKDPRACVYIDKGRFQGSRSELKFFSDRNWYVADNCEYKQAFVCKSNIAEVDLSPPKDDRGDFLDCPKGSGLIQDIKIVFFK